MIRQRFQPKLSVIGFRPDAAKNRPPIDARVVQSVRQVPVPLLTVVQGVAVGLAVLAHPQVEVGEGDDDVAALT